MKLKLIKDNEVVANKAHYDAIELRCKLLKNLIDGVNCGNAVFYIDFFQQQARVYIKSAGSGICLPIKVFDSDDPDYNRVCAEELVELLNQGQ